MAWAKLVSSRFLSFPLVSSSLSCCFLMFLVVSCVSPYLLSLFYLFSIFFFFPFSPFLSLLPLVVPSFEYCLNRQCSARSPDPLRWKHTLHPDLRLRGLRVNLLLPCLPIVYHHFSSDLHAVLGFIRHQPHVAQHKLVL